MLEWCRSQESAMALRALREPCRGHLHSVSSCVGGGLPRTIMGRFTEVS